jgi:hypothetical protein
VRQHLSQETKDYILRLHWAGYPFSAIAFKTQKAHGVMLTREMVDELLGEALLKKGSANA